jgi:hypothetical protein
MSNSQHGTSLVSTLLLCIALNGCGNSNTATSSTNDTQPPANDSDNQAPTAHISGSRSFLSGETVTLDGSGLSGPDGDHLMSHWSQTAGPTLNLSATSNSSLNFVAPAVAQATA